MGEISRIPAGYHPMECDPMTAPDAAGDMRIVPQPVSAPLTRAAIFLVVTVNPGPDNRATVRSFCADLAALLRAVEFRDLEARPVLRHGVRVRRVGPGCSASRGRRSCIRSARFAPERATRSPRRATCCSTSVRSAWISASSSRRRSWRASAMRSRRSTRCTASATSTTAISWASSTERRIRGARP